MFIGIDPHGEAFEFDPDNVRHRDVVLWAVLRGDMPWDTVRNIVDNYPDHAATYAILGCLAWADGVPSTARILVDAALQIDPNYGLALLLDRSLVANMPAEPWVEQLTSWDYEYVAGLI